MNTTTEIRFNQQQQDVLNWARHSKGSLNLVARAGCGKTTTLIMLVEEIVQNQSGKNIFLGAFNKAIASEIGERLKARGIEWRVAESSTLHAIGFRLWRNVAKGVKVDEKKVINMIFDAAERGGPNSVYALSPGPLRTLVSLAKQTGFGWLVEVDDDGAWHALIEHHGVELDGEVSAAEAIVAAQELLKKSYALDRTLIDFDDMIAAPIVHNVVVRYPYDYVLIDEAQDTNAARRSLALKLLRPVTGRMIAVGDDRQAIYGFTGADSNAMDLLRNELNSVLLPLNVTYRCPKAIVAEAQRIVPDIVAHESAPDGVVRTEELTLASLAQFRKDDVILCRNTAPLIELAYLLIGMKVPCRVEGRDIGKAIETLARRWKIKKLPALRSKLEGYLERETAKWLAKGREEKVAAIEDKVASLLALIDVCTKEKKETVDDLCNLIREMFGDTPAGTAPNVLTLSTVHKSKGREWPRVFILKAAEYMPSRWARKAWQLHQEQNLIYVAITRAQRELIYLN